jgi:hypothetical protein
MAKAHGFSRMTVQRIWKQYNLKPHLVETSKLSRDKRFLEKLHDVVGLYLNPPDKAIVLCVDEKSQIQALDRTRPLLPLRPGLPARQTHDYKRNGTTTLFAAPPALVFEKELRDRNYLGILTIGEYPLSAPELS